MRGERCQKDPGGLRCTAEGGRGHGGGGALRLRPQLARSASPGPLLDSQVPGAGRQRAVRKGAGPRGRGQTHLTGSCWTSACAASRAPSSLWGSSSASRCCSCRRSAPSPDTHTHTHVVRGRRSEGAPAAAPPPRGHTSSEPCISGQIQWMSSSLCSSPPRLLRVRPSSASSGESACAGSRGGR